MKLFLQSLGCDKNLSDAEHMLFLIREKGYEITDVPEDADVILVNTCCFIADALQESIDSVLSYASLKETGNLKALLISGCMAQRFKDEIRKELPEIDGIIGINSIDEVCTAIEEAVSGNKTEHFRPLSDRPSDIKGRTLSSGSGVAYLKIAEGCNKNCSYCIIPSVRGPYRSIEKEILIREAKELAEEGVKELILVAQETTLYGIDIYKKKALPELLSELSGITGIEWIRLMYCYPEEIEDELLISIRDNKKVLPYFDMPIQHASDKILRSMGRRTNKSELENKIKRIREILPDVTLRTTIIAGYPGETEEDVSELLEFLSEAKFDRLGVFAYSPEEGTSAEKMPDQVPDEIKQERLERIMLHQQEICFKKNEDQIGKDLTAIIEGYLPDENVYVGRTKRDAPDIDGMIFIENLPFEPVSGTFVNVKVTGQSGYDLVGEYYESTE